MMIIALLIVIICILLFGAAAIRDLFFKVICLGAATIILVVVLVWSQKVFGPNAVVYLGFGVVALLGMGGLWARYDDSHAVKMRRRIREREKDKRSWEVAKAVDAHQKELKLRKARERFETVYGNQPNLTKAEKKRRKDLVLGRSIRSLDGHGQK